MGLKSEIKSFFKGDVLEDPGTLANFSRDTSLFEVRPKMVVFPKDVEDIKNLVKFVQKTNPPTGGLSLTCRSAGTDMTGGPLNESIIVVFTKYFKKIKEVGEDYVIAEPGVFYRDLEKETMKKDLIMPSYPASREICAVGGMVANNAGGEKTLSYGKTEDYVKELKVVLKDGNEYTIKPLNKEQLDQKINRGGFEGKIYQEIYKLISENHDLIKSAKPQVSKNSAGYNIWKIWDGEIFDLTKLFVGSQGTLGIVTEVKFKLMHPKKFSKMLVIFLKDLNPLATVVHKVLEFKPESFESFDDHTLKLGIQYLFFRFALKFLPELWMIVTGGLPRLVLIAEFTGDSQEEVNGKAHEAQNALKEFGVKTRITTDQEDARKYWTIRRESFNLLRTKIKSKKTAPFIDDIIVFPEKLPKFLPKLDELLKKYEITYTIAGHIGDGNFHIIPLMDLSDPKSKKIIIELTEKVYDLVFEFKGSMTAEHNDGLIRTPFLHRMYGDKIYNLFKDIKKILDPDNIFNPGKKVDGELDYAINHLKKK
ncbi:MAG: FAD-binding oxidoreductase [Patescibacteria group bacterium]